jgi:hypothetical protein
MLSEGASDCSGMVIESYVVSFGLGGEPVLKGSANSALLLGGCGPVGSGQLRFGPRELCSMFWKLSVRVAEEFLSISRDARRTTPSSFRFEPPSV